MEHDEPIDRAERHEYPFDHMVNPLQREVNPKRATLRRDSTGPNAAAEYLDDEASAYDLEE